MGGMPRQPGMMIGDPALGGMGNPLFQPMDMNDLDPDLPGMPGMNQNNPLF